ncbi:hemerythrin domain-containing protein [Cupriavidus sp. WKF15]|uniref:hemerythrin domain-containing protein n=1 Tax=Cupriavidus sp. WKF15 TaxID=3032282 RepID=UPI0023E19F6F|nr:hemerythrin domain-containing protein [Cupriavidus sp. WKF15]WER51009.1 hemerythrin domain-containing protein [Cupriavidus sp. WKF15]
MGGDEPLAAMSGMHREIFRLVRMLQRMTRDAPPDGPDEAGVWEYPRLHYGLEEVLRMHCAQEDEFSHALGDDALDR